jgi:large subunit ribosomal protein L21
MNYAIIELGGKQYRVEKGDSVVVDRLDAREGAKVTPKALLLRAGNKTVFEGAELEKVRVEAVVAEHLRGEKVRIFKYRPKKRYRRRAGHRSALTRLEIRDIKGPVAEKKAGPRQAEGRVAEGTASSKPAAESPAKPAPKPAAKKPAPAKKKEPTTGQAKKPAARKPAAKKTTPKD